MTRDTLPAWSSPEMEEWLSRLAQGVDTTVTLGNWMVVHPADSVSQALPGGLNAESFCRSAAASIRAGTKVWRRSAVFLIAPALPGERLPPAKGLADLYCRLRAVWLESIEPDSQSAFQQTDALQGRLTRLLGEGRAGVFMIGQGMGDWQRGRSWIDGRKVVVVGADPGRTYYRENVEAEWADTTPIVQPPTALAVSYVTGNGLDIGVSELVDQISYPRVEPQALASMARADSAIERAGLTGLLPLHQLFQRYRDSVNFPWTSTRPPSNPWADSLLIQALATLSDTASLPPRQRSAAFLAADIAVQTYGPWLDYGGGRDSLLRMALGRLGAPYEDRHLAASWMYTRPWLWRAYQLDSLGPSGKSAFAELLATGWGPDGCGPAPVLAEAVIERGERALASRHDDPMIRLYLAQAYADLFSLSPEGVPASASDSLKAQAAKSEDARRRAVVHYQAALRELRDPGLRRTTWDKAVRLMLQLPIQTRYFCTGD